MKYIENVRNFCIIAHIDHGKSTLADRLLEKTGTIAERDMQDQLLDSMDIERERGITIKLNAARMNYKAKDGKDYILNLIDTPGHVDFSYEVSRSLAACEGALLIVDATQGVEAQTLSNVYLAIEQNLEIIPVINKIDLPSADVERVRAEIEEVLGIDASMAIPVSAKAGIGIEDLLENILLVSEMAELKANPNKQAKGAVIEAKLDKARGPVATMLVQRGTLDTGDTIVVGSVIGRIRAMYNDKGKKVKKAGPSTPVEIIGLTEVPVAGETFLTFSSFY